MAQGRTKKMGILLLLALVIHQSMFANCDVAKLEDPTLPGLNELDNSTGLVSVSDNCSEYGIDNLPHPRFILLGPTGSGKSTLANQLLGRNPLNEAEHLFSVGHDVESQTIKITYVVGNWLGDGPCFTIIDTPGTSDSEGRDYEHALAMANIMKDQIKSVDIFLLCFSGQDSRFDRSVVQLLKLYESIFSKVMWNHAVTEVTYWSHDRRSMKMRSRRKGMNEIKRHKQWNSQYKQELGVTIDIPSVYIDPVLLIFDAEEAEFLEAREKEAFKKYTDELFEYGNNSEPFYCDGNCKSPNGYFLGNPWIESNNITIRQGEKAVIKCQIWNGIQGKASNNVQWTHNGEVIYEKTTSENETMINTTDAWGSNVKFVEMLSPGEGHYTNFIIKFEALEESMEGNYTCENGRITDDNVADVFMRVDGMWSEWAPWGQCSISCLAEDNQMGYKKRVREAVPPRNGGNPVNPIDGEDTQICAGEQGPDKPIRCPKDFSWNSWTEWSECSAECGDGIKYRMRSCNQGSNSGMMCPLSLGNNLSDMEEKPCKIKDCPDCILLEWQEWSQCSKTCTTNQPGTKKRQRITKEADPSKPQCNPHEYVQEKTCNTNPCPKDFSWNSWTEWSECTPRCGAGNTYRMRFCNQGSNGGKMCPPLLGHTLSEKAEKKCKIKDCPNCILLGWQEWSQCTKTCLGRQPGTRTRQRSTKEADSNNPQCNPDDHSQREICNTRRCPEPGSWTPWSSYGPCSATCGSPSPRQIRTRSCTQPPPMYGGTPCTGAREDVRDCNTKPCPVDGTWRSWSSWSGCSATCGSPTRSRTRSCTAPQHGGKPCHGPSQEFRSCTATRCPVKLSLIGGSSNFQGNVFYKGQPVCDDGWDGDRGKHNADVVCRELGFSGAISFTRESHFGSVPSSFSMDSVICTGSESRLEDCSYSTNEDCGATEGVGVICSKLSLVGSSKPSEGNVYYKGQPVCDDTFSDTQGYRNAEVVCKELGFSGAKSYTRESHFESVPSTFSMDDVICTGSESRLEYCSYSSNDDCGASEGAGVVCRTTKLTLVGGSSPKEGNVYYNGKPVCDDYWSGNIDYGIRNGKVVCRELGYSGSVRPYTSSHFGQVPSVHGMDDVKCTGAENRLEDCPHITSDENCGAGEGAGVVCFESKLTLVGGSSPNEGNVYYNGKPVCDDYWSGNIDHGNRNGKVVCRELGYSGSVRPYSGSHFGQVPSNHSMDDVKCTGAEYRLEDCPHITSDENCGAGEGAGVVCFESKLTLVGGSSPNEGNVYYNGKPVCDDYWSGNIDHGNNNGQVVCRELGYSGFVRSYIGSHFGQVLTIHGMDDVKCTGAEYRLEDCPHSTSEDCGAGEGAGVVCTV